jgi:hypothetical protein
MSVAITRITKSVDVVVVKSMKDFRDEPVFKKKAEKAKAFIAKNGLPKFKKK